MRYFGGKERLSKHICKFINETYLKGNDKTFVDLFVGGCSIISKIDSNRKRYANDKNTYLISMWKALQKGWIPPKDLTKEQYMNIKNHKNDYDMATVSFVGFGCSFGGKWFGGYANDCSGRNYCLHAHNSTMRKASCVSDVIFTNLDYRNVEIPLGSIVYCDKPYENTCGYNTKTNNVDKFNHDIFWQWVRDNSCKHTILVSEYVNNIPKDFDIVWIKDDVTCSMLHNKRLKTTEAIAIYKREG